MLEKEKELKIENFGTIVSFKCSTVFNDNAVLEWFELISQDYPQHVFSKDNKENEFKLVNYEGDTSTQSSIIFINLNQLVFSFGSMFDLEKRDLLITDSIKKLEKSIKGLTPFKLDLVECIYHYGFKYKEDHTKIINKVFFKDSPVNQLFLSENQKLFQNDFDIRGSIDENRIAIISIEGGTADSEIRSAIFEEKKFNIKISIGLTKNFNKVGKTFSEIVATHDKISNAFLKEYVEETVFKPINNYLSTM